MSDRKPWISLQRYAKENYEAYQILKENTKDDFHLLNIKYYLLCRSLELSFKSLLVFNNITSFDDLKHKYGHDLVKLVGDCEPIGTFTLNKTELTIVKVLNSYYIDKQF